MMESNNQQQTATKCVRLDVWVPADMKARLVEQARVHRRPMSEFVCEGIDVVVQYYEGQKAVKTLREFTEIS